MITTNFIANRMFTELFNLLTIENLNWKYVYKMQSAEPAEDNEDLKRKIFFHVRAE